MAPAWGSCTEAPEAPTDPMAVLVALQAQARARQPPSAHSHFSITSHVRSGGRGHSPGGGSGPTGRPGARGGAAAAATAAATAAELAAAMAAAARC